MRIIVLSCRARKYPTLLSDLEHEGLTGWSCERGGQVAKTAQSQVDKHIFLCHDLKQINQRWKTSQSAKGARDPSEQNMAWYCRKSAGPKGSSQRSKQCEKVANQRVGKTTDDEGASSKVGSLCREQRRTRTTTPPFPSGHARLVKSGSASTTFSIIESGSSVQGLVHRPQPDSVYRAQEERALRWLDAGGSDLWRRDTLVCLRFPGRCS